MDVFEAYSKRAGGIVNNPQRLVGTIKTRGVARERYAQIVREMTLCPTADALEVCLADLAGEIAQYRAELEFLWFGEGDFLGLEKEIERARARVDDGLDFPRWETGQLATENEG